MSNIKIFSNSNFQIRTVCDEDTGVIWFVAQDVANALEYAESSKAARLFRAVPERFKDVKPIHTHGGEQNMLCLNESGLYFFLGRSDKPKAIPYQMWIASDVVPSIRKTGSYSVPSLSKNQQSQQHQQPLMLPTGAMEGAKFIFENAGISGNQMILALDKVYHSFLGLSALKAGDIKLEAPSKKQTLTPTEIGKIFNTSGQKINNVLSKAGYQRKIAGKWEPTEKGASLGVMLDTGKKYGNGTPVRQLKWESAIVDELKAVMP